MTKLNKLLSIALSVLFILSVAPITLTASAAETYTSEDGYLTYTVSNGEATITDHTSISGDYTIPDTLGGYPVTVIGRNSFSYCTSLASITIPDSVTSIGEKAFYGCTSLKSIMIPDSVTSIGYRAFYNTAYYNKDSNWEDGVLYIGNHLIEADSDIISGSYEIKDGTKIIADYAFENCTSLASITIPDSVSSIGDNAFYGCTSLESIIIPDSVTSIGNSAFSRCTSLERIIIPDSVTLIGSEAFSDCTSLASITISNSVTSIGDHAFYNTAYYNDDSNWEDTVLYIGNHLIKVKANISGSYAIKEGTKIIADYAFYNCSRIEGITIPNSVISIGDCAFWNCTSLTSITILDSVTSIGDWAFGYTLFNELIDGFIIYGHTGTAAETYAKNNDITFICSHVWGDGEVTAEATCTEDGGTTYTCTFCGDTKTEAIPAMGHDYITLTTAPTCTESGYTTYTCSVCGDTYTADETAVTGHTYGDGVVTGATCTEDGNIKYVCTVCNYSHTEAIEAIGHSYGDWVVVTEATAEQEGLEQRECSVCGEIETRVIEKIIEEEPTTAEPTVEESSTEETDTEKVPFAVDEALASLAEGTKRITIPADTSAEDFRAIVTGGSFKLFNADGEELEGESLVGTGCKVQTLDSEGNIVSEYTVIVPSDVDGNGKVTAADARLALRAAAQLDTLESVYLIAADFDADSAIKPADARSILRVAAKLD